MEEIFYTQRISAIDRYINGENPLSIYTSFHHSKKWFFKWLNKYRSGDPEWYHDSPRKPHTNPQKTPPDIEALITLVRLELYNEGVFCGAQAIVGVLEERGITPIPCVRTIERIIQRNDLTHKRTGRYIPRGTLYPRCFSDKPNERQQADLIGPLYLDIPLRFYAMNVIDVATNRCGLQPLFSLEGYGICCEFRHVWQRLGMPSNLYVDNAMYFYGSPQYPRAMGPLIRFCLLYGIEPWFIPVKEPWRNGVIEKFNDHYQQKFLAKIQIPSKDDLGVETLRYENKHNTRYRYSKLKGKTPTQAFINTGFGLRLPPKDAPQWPLKKPTKGKYHLIRLIRSDMKLDIFSEKFNVDPDLQYEYVVATIDVKEQKLNLFHDNMLVDEFNYKLR
jgi:putative transposase